MLYESIQRRVRAESIPEGSEYSQSLDHQRDFEAGDALTSVPDWQTVAKVWPRLLKRTRTKTLAEPRF